MNYGVILAGGKGSRMKSLEIPKQYYEINGIPVIVYTLKKFIEINCFDYIYIAINNDYKELMNSLLKNYFQEEIPKITLVEGGNERIDSIHNVIKSININEINDDDVIVIHDAVRPFVTDKIILVSLSFICIFDIPRLSDSF